MTEPTEWGNPAHRTFAAQRIRLVAVDEIRLKVHKVLVPIVEKVFQDLSTTDLVVAKAEGHPVSVLGTGFTLVLDPPQPEVVATVLAAYGFVPDASLEDHYEWAGSYTEAVAAHEAIENGAPEGVEPSADTAGGDDATEGSEDPTGAAEPVVTAELNRDDPAWFNGLPGSRELRTGVDYVGRDVLFLQCYLGVPRTGVYDPETVAAVAYFKQRRGLPADGDMDREGWQQFLPRLRRAAFPGDAGRAVRILCSALIAAGAMPDDEPVSGRYNLRVQRLVREFQTVHELRRTGHVTGLEWSRLLVHPWG